MCYKKLKKYTFCSTVILKVCPIVNSLLSKWSIYDTVNALSQEFMLN